MNVDEFLQSHAIPETPSSRPAPTQAADVATLAGTLVAANGERIILDMGTAFAHIGRSSVREIERDPAQAAGDSLPYVIITMDAEAAVSVRQEGPARAISGSGKRPFVAAFPTDAAYYSVPVSVSAGSGRRPGLKPAPDPPGPFGPPIVPPDWGPRPPTLLLFLKRLFGVQLTPVGEDTSGTTFETTVSTSHSSDMPCVKSTTTDGGVQADQMTDFLTDKETDSKTDTNET